MKGTKSHYVPQFYLKNFGNFIYQYDKTNQQISRVTPRSAAAERSYYADLKDSEMIEKSFGRIESLASKAIQKIVRSGSLSLLSASDIDAICGFIALQFTRTPEFRELRREHMNRLYDNKAKSLGVADWTIREKEDYANSWHTVSILYYLPIIRRFMINMKYNLLRNNTSIPLWTSDNPVVFSNESRGEPVFISTRTVVYLPLTPKLLLVSCKKSIMDAPHTTMSKAVWEDQLCKPHILKNGSMRLFDVIYANYLQTKFSKRFVFSSKYRFPAMKAFLDTVVDNKWWRIKFSCDEQRDDAIISTNWVATEPLGVDILRKNVQDMRWWYRTALRKKSDDRSKFFLLYTSLEIATGLACPADADMKKFNVKACSLTKVSTPSIEYMGHIYNVVKSGGNPDREVLRQCINTLLYIIPKIFTHISNRSSGTCANVEADSLYS